MKQLLLVFLGGGLGSVARFAVTKLVVYKQLNLIWGTLAVNVIGSLLIGLILGYTLKTTGLKQNTALLLATGFCGGFTTFSTFAYENQGLLRTGDYTTLLLYTIGSFVLGILAVFLGLWLVKSLS